MFLEFPVELQLILQPYDRPPGLWFSVATWPAGQMKSCDLRYSTPGRRKGGRETESRVKEGSAKNLYQSNVILLIKHWTTACEIQIGPKECRFICEAMCSGLKPFVHAAQCGTEIILRKWLFLDWYCLWASSPHPHVNVFHWNLLLFLPWNAQFTSQSDHKSNREGNHNTGRPCCSASSWKKCQSVCGVMRSRQQYEIAQRYLGYSCLVV